MWHVIPREWVEDELALDWTNLYWYNPPPPFAMVRKALEKAQVLAVW